MSESPITRDELREKIEHILVSTQQDGAGIAMGRKSTDGTPYKSRITEFTDLILQELDKAVRQTNISQIENWRDWIKDDKDSAWLVKEMDDAIESLKDETLTDCNGVFLEFTTSNERGL